MANLVSNGKVVSTGTTRANAEITQKILKAIGVLQSQKTGKYAGTPGIHVVYSGLNEELRRVGVDPIATLNNLEAQGFIESQVCRGGKMVYLAGQKPAPKPRQGKAFGLLG